MSDGTEETIVVTGKRLTTAGAIGGGFTGPTLLSYTQQAIPEIFEQDGGKETVTTASFSLVNGDLIVRLPGYDFPIKVPAASWQRMTSAQKGAFIKLMTEFSQSSEMTSFLNHLQSQGASAIEIHFDDDVHLMDGTTDPFQMADMPEEIRWIAASGDETDLANGTKVVITINSDVVDSAKEFSEVLIHALGHPLHGVTQADEDYLRSREGHIYDQIFNTPGERETRPEDYYEGTTITGSRYDDNVIAGSGNDTLSGLSGNDNLNGGLGNDLVMGGAGMDRLSGGAGDNMVAGGLDADTYAPAWASGSETVVELGGVDRIDLSAYWLSDCTFFRTGDTLGISLLSGMQIFIENQWLAGSKVEQFTFANGTFASSYIEQLAESSSGGPCYDEYGRQILCSPFGLPVVLDLDGDGIELLPVERSRARFDMDGDEIEDRLGWVGRDDGILVLDRNGNERIDDFSEMSFVHDFLGAATDLEGLFAYDSNGDGFLTQADERFGEFLVWRDSNGNGKSEKHELFTLDNLGIISIALERSNINPLRPNEETNQILGTSAFETIDGRQGQVGDVALFIALAGADCGCHAGEFPTGSPVSSPLSGIQFDGLVL